MVNIDWSSWDRQSDEPEEYPPGDEPEDYILNGEHDEALAQSVGRLWLIDRQIIGYMSVGKVIVPENSSVDDFLKTVDTGYTIVSRAVKEWIEEHCGEWLEFLPVLLLDKR